MALNKDKLEKLGKLITMAKSLEKFLAMGKDLEKRFDDKLADNDTKFESLVREFKEVIEESKLENNKFSGIRQKTIDAINNLFIKNDINKKLNEKLKEADAIFARIDDKLSKVRNGKDSDDKAIIEAILAQIEPSERGESGKKGDTGDKGKDGDSFDSKEFDKLREELFETMAEELRKHRRIGGGGTSAIGVAQAMKYIGKTEQPSGTIDGANKVFTVSQDIFYVLGFTINNQQIAELPNFTISGKIITFDLAIPSSYSGKDFEIKYF